jgi:uncharacterized protein YidB (DUF937 family)
MRRSRRRRQIAAWMWRPINHPSGPGPNQPIQPGQPGSALGQTAVTELAARAGMSEQETPAEFSRVLPRVVDKLTPDGRVPDPSEIATHSAYDVDAAGPI